MPRRARSGGAGQLNPGTDTQPTQKVTTLRAVNKLPASGKKKEKKREDIIQPLHSWVENAFN